MKTYCPGVEVVATATDAATGRSAMLQHRPDQVFFDIQMPGKSGLTCCGKSWVKEDGGYLLLDNSHQAPVSRNKKEVVAWALK